MNREFLSKRSANSVFYYLIPLPIFAPKTKIMVYWTLDYFKILYGEYAACGVSVREFCRERGIKENRFYYWIKTLKSQAVSALDIPREFIPISSEAVSSLTGISLDTQKEKMTQVKTKTQDIMITYPSGVILQLGSGFDLEILKQLITLTP